MPKGNKIERNNLQSEVYSLLSAGLSRVDIAKAVNDRHPEVTVGAMTVQRFLDKDKIKSIQDKINAGGDPDEELRIEFRDRISDLDDETHEIYSISKTALKNIVEEGDSYKVVRAAKDVLASIEASRRNWNTLIDRGTRMAGLNQEAKEVNYIQINNQLIALSKDLCPTCRKKIVDKILDVEDVNTNKEKKIVEEH